LKSIWEVVPYEPAIKLEPISNDVRCAAAIDVVDYEEGFIVLSATLATASVMLENYPSLLVVVTVLPGPRAIDTDITLVLIGVPIVGAASDTGSTLSQPQIPFPSTGCASARGDAWLARKGSWRASSRPKTKASMFQRR
jgi:hypothetical protein